MLRNFKCLNYPFAGYVIKENVLILASNIVLFYLYLIVFVFLEINVYCE